MTPEAYFEPCQTSKIEHFVAKIVKDETPLAIFVKCFVVVVWQGSGCVSNIWVLSLKYQIDFYRSHKTKLNANETTELNHNK